MSENDRRRSAGGSSGNVTRLLADAQQGKVKAADDLLQLVYAELKTIAAARVRYLRPGQTLTPTALVHEAYLKLLGEGGSRFESRAHFFGAASQAMRDLLVDYARRRAAQKRGGDKVRVADEVIDAIPAAIALPFEDLLALDAALNKMREEHPRKAEIVMLRYFAGLTEDEVAELLGVTTRTIEREWRFAKAWLYRALREDAPHD